MFLLIMQLAVGGPTLAPQPARYEGLVVKIDPGHGARNSGHIYTFKHKGKYHRIVEKVYNCDVSARMIRELRVQGVTVVSTTTGKCLDTPRDGTLLDARAISEDMFFVTTGEVVRYDSAAMEQRVLAGKDSAHISVSIHFDYADSRSPSGAYAIVADDTLSISWGASITSEMAVDGRVRTICYESVVVNATCKHLRDLFIPRRATFHGVPWVLLELGNMRNEVDRECMLSATCREQIAQTAVRAILNRAMVLTTASKQ
jgi:N-acetylmuramoyl-L-alanine amidase